MRIRISIVLAVMVMIVSGGGVFSPWAAEDNRAMMMKSLRDTLQVPEEDRFLFEFSPCYYRYKSETADWISASVFFKAEISRSWEISVGGDILSYQDGDLGVGDWYAGARWTFYDLHDVSMALSGYVLFPTGHRALREPGIEPTLTLMLSRTLGDWEIDFSIGSTFAADAQGEPNYLDWETGLEVSYSPDENNSFSAMVSGYTPDQRTDGGARIWIGASYTRKLSDHHSMGIMLTRGLSGSGMDWSSTLTYSFSF